MMVHALIHTQGVVLNRTYIALELAYQDVSGFRTHFIITSPISFSKMKQKYRHVHADVLVTTHSGTPYSNVIQFLKDRQAFLRLYCKTDRICFGFKGNSYQPQILRDAGIADTINVEIFEVVPPLAHSGIWHPHCSWHKSRGKCALVALEHILFHLHCQ